MDTYLIFLLGQEYFGVPVSYVLEVLQKQPITRIPKTPEHILGIINFRGEILPVVDTHKKFAMDKAEQELNIIIVFETGVANNNLTVAATADAVKDVIEVKDNEIKAVPELGLSYDSRFIVGVVKRDENFILLLNIDKIFSATDLAVVQQIQTSESSTNSD